MFPHVNPADMPQVVRAETADGPVFLADAVLVPLLLEANPGYVAVPVSVLVGGEPDPTPVNGIPPFWGRSTSLKRTEIFHFLDSEGDVTDGP